jgi:hypothetical protein
MAMTQETMAGKAAEACQADPNNSSDAPSAPDNEDNDNESNPPNQDGDFATDGLDNLDAIICRDMIAMYVHVLGFKEGALTALYDDQQITDLNRLCELDDPTIKELCRQISKEGHPVSMILQNCLKLLVFWTKHM